MKKFALISILVLVNVACKKNIDKPTKIDNPKQHESNEEYWEMLPDGTISEYNPPFIKIIFENNKYDVYWHTGGDNDIAKKNLLKKCDGRICEFYDDKNIVFQFKHIEGKKFLILQAPCVFVGTNCQKVYRGDEQYQLK